MASLGEELRKQREIRQISLREISDSTKISIRFLEGIERNDFSHLPGGQFTKGFIRAYARHVGIDPEKMIEAYEAELLRQNEEARTAQGDSGSGFAWKGLYTVVIVAISILIVLASLAGWFLLKRAPPPKPSSTSAGRTVSPALAPPIVPRDEPFSMRLNCLAPVAARVYCDGQLAYEGELQTGDLRSEKCQGELKITMGDQLSLTVSRGAGSEGSATQIRPPALTGDATPRSQSLPPGTTQ